MLANTTVFGEADVLAVILLLFLWNQYFQGDFGIHFSAMIPIFSEHISALASDLPKQLAATLSISDTFSAKLIIFANHAKTLFQAINSKP